MKHGRNTPKLGRLSKHRESLLANLFCSLVEHNRVKTTLAKAKALRPFAEKLLTLGKKGGLSNHRLAISRVHQEDAVKKLFDKIAPRFKERAGGYTRVVKLGPRQSDSAPMAIIEWVDYVIEKPAEKVVDASQPEAAPAKEKKAKAPKAEKAEKAPKKESEKKSE